MSESWAMLQNLVLAVRAAVSRALETGGQLGAIVWREGVDWAWGGSPPWVGVCSQVGTYSL